MLIITDPKSGVSYVQGEEIGRGAFGICYRAIVCGGSTTPKVEPNNNHLHSNHKTTLDNNSNYLKNVRTENNTNTITTVVLKWLSRELLRLRPDREERVASELRLRTRLPVHSNVVQCLSSFETECGRYQVLELCQGPSLADILQQRGRMCTNSISTDGIGRFNEHEAAFLLSELLSGCQFLHSHKIIHRDLKPSNLLLSSIDDCCSWHSTNCAASNPADGRWRLKISDLGMACSIQRAWLERQIVCGTPNYLAPEILLRKGHSYKSDIWAIAITLYTLLTGRPPFDNANLMVTYQNIVDLSITYSSLLSPLAKDFIESVLRLVPSHRASINELLQHPFLDNTIPLQNKSNVTHGMIAADSNSHKSLQNLRGRTPKFGGKLRRLLRKNPYSRRKENSTSSVESSTSRTSTNCSCNSTFTTYGNQQLNSRFTNNCISIVDPAWKGVCKLNSKSPVLLHFPNGSGIATQKSPLFPAFYNGRESRRPPLENSSFEADRLYACLRNRVAWHAKERGSLCWILRWAEHAPHSYLLYTLGILDDQESELAALAVSHGLLVPDGTICVLDQLQRVFWCWEMNCLIGEGSVLGQTSRYIEPLLEELQSGLAHMDKSLGMVRCNRDAYSPRPLKCPERIIQWKRIDNYTAFQFDDASIQINLANKQKVRLIGMMCIVKTKEIIERILVRKWISMLLETNDFIIVARLIYNFI